MIKAFCDRCGDEIKSSTLFLEWIASEEIQPMELTKPNKRILCYSCRLNFFRFLNQEEVNHK